MFFNFIFLLAIAFVCAYSLDIKFSKFLDVLKAKYFFKQPILYQNQNTKLVFKPVYYGSAIMIRS